MNLNPLLLVTGFLICFLIVGYSTLQLLHLVAGRKLVKSRYILLQAMDVTEQRTKYNIIHLIDSKFHGGSFTGFQTASCSVIFNNDIELLVREKLVKALKHQTDDGSIETTYTLTRSGQQKTFSIEG